MIFLDGTFRCCPPQFKQVYSIHASLHGVIVPVVFAFLADKTMNTYVQFLTSLRKIASSLGLDFAPKEARLDFEIGMMKALQRVIPGIKVVGCNFHLTKSITEKLNKLSLIQRYRSSKTFHTFVNAIISLQHIPVDQVLTQYLRLKSLFLPQLSHLPSEALASFLQYLDHTWLSDRAIYVPSMWNHFGSFEHLSNNIVENFHKHLNARLRCEHPALVVLIDHLKDVQDANENRVFESLHSKSQKREYCVIKKQNYQLIAQAFQSKTISVERLLELATLVHFKTKVIFH
jgi:hypothetical protein